MAKPHFISSVSPYAATAAQNYAVAFSTCVARLRSNGFAVRRCHGLELRRGILNTKAQATAWAFVFKMVAGTGVEPVTRGFSVPCSTN